MPNAIDIFISYAHADDEVPRGTKSGWVTTLVDELKKILRRKLGGSGAEIWMDHQLAAHKNVSAELLDKLRASRTLVLVLSPAATIGSPSCGPATGRCASLPGRLSIRTRSASNCCLVNPLRKRAIRLVAPIDAELRRGPLGLVHLVEDAARRTTGAQPFDLLVLVDQFEEIFRYSECGAPQADESKAFVNLLLESRAFEKARIYIALVIRSDFLGNCVGFLELPEAINRGQYLTPRLAREQLAAAIREPARVFGGDVEAELVNDLINAVSRDPDQLPILQHALARMWESAIARDASTPCIMSRGVLKERCRAMRIRFSMDSVAARK